MEYWERWKGSERLEEASLERVRTQILRQAEINRRRIQKGASSQENKAKLKELGQMIRGT